MIEFIKYQMSNMTISEYAMTVNMQIADRMKKYNNDGGSELV